MAARVSEAFVLRSYPFQEGDLIVSFLARDAGKLRGVAKRARRPKSTFGSGLERLSYVRMTYLQKETRELVSLFTCELIQSQFALQQDYTTGIALDFLAEVTDQLMPPHETNERFFRLIKAVLEDLHTKGDPWRAVLYFLLWAVRLSGFLPPLRVSEEAQVVADEMMRTPIGQLTAREWSRTTAGDLRRSLTRLVEEQVERRLVTAAMLETL